MKKFLIWTALVLAAITACNKEIDTQLTSNTPEEPTIEAKKVTLTIKASIEAETRTAYENDQKATWQVDDKITVCVTNSSHSDFLLYDLKAEIVNDELVFAGEVDENYTTVVSGIYPAQDNYHLDTPVENTNKKYFNIGAEGDGTVIGIYLPDTYDLETANDTGRYIPMVGEMVHDNDNNTDTFTFHHICGALKITVVDIFNALTFTTAGETITGNFPLTNGRIEMPESGSSSTVTFNYGRLPREEGYIGERESRTFYIPVPIGALSGGATMALKNGNKVVFDKKTTNNNSIVFDSKVIKRLQAIKFSPRNDWSINPDFSGDKAVIYFNVQNENDKYIRIPTTKNNFKNKYHGSFAEIIEERLHGSYQTLTGSSHYDFDNSISQYFDAGAEKVFIMLGVTSTTTNRKFTFDYCLVEDTVPDPATPEYRAWLGDWQVTEDTETDPKTDTWTITRKETNGSYIIKGIAKRNTVEAVGIFSSDDNGLSLYSQTEIGTYKYSGTDYTVSLFVNTPSFTSKVGNLIVSLSQEDGTVTIKESNGYGLYWVNPTSNKWTTVASLKRNPISTMNRAPEQ